MKTVKAILLLATGALLLAGTALAAEPAKTVLSNSDCVKCHAKPPADIEAKGKAHKTAIGCQDCHQGHPPAVAKEKIIPKCTMCHEGKPHFSLSGCLGCHRNPHTPKEISFGRDVTDPCLTCHSPQIAQLKQSPSKHSKLNCSFCHDVHGKVPQCTQCHKSHSADIVQTDCKKCHRAHMPKSVAYGADISSKFCGACHSRAFGLLNASKAKHHTLLCVTCHQEKHKMVPKCQDCHGVPHPQGLMNKFPRCGDCHGIAHDLNNWPPASETRKEEPKKAPATPAPAKKK